MADVSYRFDDIVVDPAAFRLLKGGEPVHIEPKALQILILLLERRDRVVTKQELFDEIWPGVAVTENALTRAVAQLRKTLGDDAEAPRFIETVPTRGYRFVGTLQSEQPAAPPAPVVAPARPVRWWPVAVLLTVSFLSLIVVIVASSVVAGRKMMRRMQKIEMSQPGGIDSSVPPIAARLLHASSRFQVSPSFSPDGGSIVYAADVDGTPHLFISTVDGDDERQLTNDEAGEAQPSWSPDGKRIAFTSVRKSGIWLVDVNGGKPVPLTTFGSRPAWSPDGTEIAFQSADDIQYGWNAYDALPPSTIWIVDVASKQTSALTHMADPAGGHGAPAWRRDGKRIAFSSCDHERCGIFTIARDSSGLTQIATDTRRLSSPLFAADGRTLYYVFALYNHSLLLGVAVDLAGDPLGKPQRLRESNPGVIQYVTLSRDGFRFCWSVVEEKSDLFVIDIGSGQPIRLTKNTTVNGTFPTFSPDARKIAYCAAASGDDSGIWIADADGSHAKGLVIGPGLKQYVQWGRSEWEVFFAAWSIELHRPVLYRASLITGRAEAVAEQLPQDASAPAISPDLHSVAFNRTIAGNTSVWISAPDGSSLQRMSDDADLARFPVWSPSGKQLAVQLRRGGSSIAILPGKKVLVTGGENWPHSWSEDGKQIAFAGRRSGLWNVWTVDVESGRTTNVTNFQSMTGWVRTPSWSPDGKRIVFEAGAPRGNLWISEPRVAQ